MDKAIFPLINQSTNFCPLTESVVNIDKMTKIHQSGVTQTVMMKHANIIALLKAAPVTNEPSTQSDVV